MRTRLFQPLSSLIQISRRDKAGIDYAANEPLREGVILLTGFFVPF